MGDIEYHDGGAYAEYHFAQYPNGMGKDGPPAFVLRAAEAAKAQRVARLGRGEHVATSSALVVQPAGSEANAQKSKTAVVGALAQRTVDGAKPSAAALEARTEETRAALEAALAQQQSTEEDFSGRNIRRREKKSALASALTLVIPPAMSGANAYEAQGDTPAPIIRSPTKEKKSSNFALMVGAEGESAPVDSSSGEGGGKKFSVPFAISSWRNKKKLIIPVEQRLAQQSHESGAEDGIGDNVMSLALAMQKTAGDVAQELQAKEQARIEEEEKRQAAIEAAEAERARALLEQSAARLTSAAQRQESRAQRLERVRLERELRERERAERRRQQLLQKAATRLNITVEALEADTQLLRTVEESVVGGGGTKKETAAAATLPEVSTHPADFGATSSGPIKREQTGEDDDDEDDTTRRPRVKGGVFASAVISNEGIRQEMEILAKMEEEGSAGQKSDGIRWSDTGHESGEDEDDEMQAIMRRKRTRL